jgi:hypothetical protein
MYASVHAAEASAHVPSSDGIVKALLTTFTRDIHFFSCHCKDLVASMDNMDVDPKCVAAFSINVSAFKCNADELVIAAGSSWLKRGALTPCC